MGKGIVLGLLAAVVASVGVVTSGAKATTPPQTDVTGVITDSHVAVGGADVTVLCHGIAKTDTTDAHGSYLVVYEASDCPFGSTVKVTAVKDGKSGIASGTAQGITTKLNLAIVNVNVPEFGIIAAIIAGGTGLGLIAHMRRRQQQEQLQF